MASMSTNMRPVIIENIVWFSCLGLSEEEMSGITGVSQGAIEKFCAVFVRAAVLPRAYKGIY